MMNTPRNVIKFIYNYLPKTDKLLKIVFEVFKLPVSPPEPPVPENIDQLIPILDLQSALKKKITTDNVVEVLLLEYPPRTRLISSIESFFGKPEATPSQKEFLSILTLRSFCALLFVPFENIKITELANYMKCLRYSIAYVRNYLSVVTDLFSAFYERIPTNQDKIDFEDFLPVIFDFTDAYPESVVNCTTVHEIIISKLVQLILVRKNESVAILSSRYFDLVSKAVMANTAPDQKDCQKILRSLLLLMEHIRSAPSQDTIIYSIISLFLSLRKHSKFDLFQLNALLNEISSNNNIFENCPYNGEYEIIDIGKLKFSFPPIPTFSKIISINTERIKYFPNLSEFDSVPFIHASHIVGNKLNCCPIDGFEQILDMLVDLIPKNSYPYYAMIFIATQEMTNYFSEISTMFIERDLYKKFFNPNFFNPELTSFTGKHKILNLRQSYFDTLSVLSNSQEGRIEIRKQYRDFLNSIISFPELFSDVMQMSYPSLIKVYLDSEANDDLYDVILKASIVQQDKHFKGDPNAEVYRTRTFTVLAVLMKNNAASKLIAHSQFCCSALIHFMFEKNLLGLMSQLYDHLVRYSSDNLTELNVSCVNNSIHNSIKYLTDIIDEPRSIEMIMNILTLLLNTVQYDPPQFAPLIISSNTILLDFFNMLDNLKKCEESSNLFLKFLQLIMLVEQCPSFNVDAVSYTFLTEVAIRIGVNEEIYDMICKIIAGQDEELTIIVHPEALKLLIISCRETDKYPKVLNLLINLCKDSVCNRCACLIGNVPFLIFDNSSEEFFDKELELFMIISQTICNRQSLFSFFRLFSSISGNTLNKYTLPCIKCLETIFQQSGSPKYFSLLQLTASHSNIPLPPLSFKDIQFGFIITAKLLIDHFGSYFFEFRAEKNSLSAYFEDDTLILSIFGDEVKTDVKIQRHKWFNISILFKQMQTCSIYINNKEKATVSIPQIPTEVTDFTKCYLFGRKSKHSCIQVQSALISAQTNYWNIPNFSIIGYNTNDILAYLGNSQTIFEFNASQIVVPEVNNINFSRIPAQVYTNYIHFYTNFPKVFEASHSVNFIVSFFAQIEYIDPVTQSSFHPLFETLLSLLELQLVNSDECEHHMRSCSTYSVIAYFLLESSPKLLSETAWKSFMHQLVVINDEDLRDHLCQWIIFNFHLWLRAPLEVQIKVYSDWHVIREESPEIINQFLSFQYIFSILNHYIPNKDNMEKIIKNEMESTGSSDIDQIMSRIPKIRRLITSFCKEPIEQGVNEADANFVLLSVISYTDKQSAIELIKLIRKILIAKETKIPTIETLSLQWAALPPIVVINKSWSAMFLHPIESICTRCISVLAESMYSKSDAVNVFSQYLLAIRPVSEEIIDSSEESNLVNCCRLSLQISEQISLQDINEMNSLSLQSPLFFFYSVACAISSPKELSDKYINYINKLIEVDLNLNMISENMNTFTCFLLIYWVITRAVEALPSVVRIFVQRHNTFKIALNIIDSISIVTNVDLSQFRTSFLDQVAEYISSIIGKQPATAVPFAETLALSIMFHHKVYSSNLLDNEIKGSIFGSEEENEQFEEEIPSFFDLAAKYSVKVSEENLPMQSFSILYVNGSWVEQKLALKIVSILISLFDDYQSNVFQALMMLLTIFFFPNVPNSSHQELVPIILKVFSKIDNQNEFVLMLLHFVSKSDPELLQQLKVDTTFLLLVNGFYALNNYCEQPPTFLPTLHQQLVTDFISLLEQYPKLPKPLSLDAISSLDEQIEHTFQPYVDKYKSGERHWRSLWRQISHEQSPFFITCNNPDQVHYKRSGMTDTLFRPMLLKQNAQFDNHLDASMKRDLYTSEQAEKRISAMSSFVKIPSPHFDIPLEMSREIIEETPIVSDKYVWKSKCEWIRVNRATEGDFTVSSDGFTFLPNEGDPVFIAADKIESIFYQYYLHRPTAVEVFTTTHRSFFFNFPEMTSHKFVSYLRSIPMPNNKFLQNAPPQIEIMRLDLVKKWVSREISTFEYLMILNEFSGRSLNNLHAYPIFPWVLIDYKSNQLNLNDPCIYRDLTKPVGALNPNRLEKLILLNNEMGEGYLYQSPYSNFFMIPHLLARLEPFTSILIENQDGKFDVATRMFHSIENNFQRVYESQQNFRELIPEFFFCPEFLKNTDGFDLGKLPSGETIDNVVLPPWAEDPEDFIYKHRQALEGEYVSQNIHNWIDLIWGYKQTGEEAIKANNTFNPKLYANVWNDLEDSSDFIIIESLLNNVGMIPIKLFDQPHPQRNPGKEIDVKEIDVKLSSAAVLEVKQIGESLFTLHDDGRINLWRSNNTTSSVVKERSVLANIHSHSSTDNVIFAFSIPNSHELIAVRSNGALVKKKSSLHIDAITCVDFYRSEIITGGRDSILVKWNLNDSNELVNTHSLMVHADVVSCLAASDAFGVVVSCSIDGLLVISYADSFSYIRSLKLKMKPNYIPKAVMITEGSGTIIVHTADKRMVEVQSTCLLFSINGNYLGELEFFNQMTAWCRALSFEGFDYIMVADEDNDVILYEVFSKEIKREIYHADSQVSNLLYQKKTNSVVISTVSGEIHIRQVF